MRSRWGFCCVGSPATISTTPGKRERRGSVRDLLGVNDDSTGPQGEADDGDDRDEEDQGEEGERKKRNRINHSRIGATVAQVTRSRSAR
jgi:hypothetical protein